MKYTVPSKSIGSKKTKLLCWLWSQDIYKYYSKMKMRQNYRMSNFIISLINTYMFYQLRSSALLELHPPIWCENKYWTSCLTGLSKWSAVSCCINSSGIKSRECVVSVISIASVFWILHSMMTDTNQDEDEGADFERKASDLDAKRKEKVN